MLQLVLENNNYSDDFLLYLIESIKYTLLTSIDNDRIKYIENRLNNNKKYEEKFKQYISMASLIKAGIRNIEYIKFNDKICIRINPNTKLKNTNIRLVDIIRLINYGNKDIEGYNIFSKIFDFFAKNIDVLMLNYYRNKLKEKR